jgi:hypothetical protein
MGESPDSLSDTIFRSKMLPALRDLGEAVVVFLLCRVGDSKVAEDFLKTIEEEERLKGIVFCSHESIDEELAVFQRVKDNRRYFGWVSPKSYVGFPSFEAVRNQKLTQIVFESS